MSQDSAISSTIMSRADNVNYVILAACSIVILAALAKLAGKAEISIKGISIKLSHLPVIMIFFTAAHFYTAYSLNTEIVQASLALNPEELRGIFETISDKGPLFFQGIMERLQIYQSALGPVFVMSWNDPSTILAHGAALGAFLVMISWTGLSPFQRLLSVCISTVIVTSNWLIGGSWAVHLSCLSDVEVCRKILQL
ncbi:MAG: hypothetical protein Q7T75_02670 [Mesorhizobium sp.]|nr:hypothetical protein [Mesorhizobium sp.]